MEKPEKEASNFGAEHEQAQDRTERREERGEEIDSDTQIDVHDRNIENLSIRKIKDKREISDTKDDNPLLEYQF